MIACLGTGLLGAGFVRALLRRGETVHVMDGCTSPAGTVAMTGR